MLVYEVRRQTSLTMADNTNTISTTVNCEHDFQTDLNRQQPDLHIFNDHDNNQQDDIDPDQFFSTVNLDCKYYSIDDFKNSVNPEGRLSIIHFNSRSMYTNFGDIKDYLQNLEHSFNIITISETWFSCDKDADFELENYELRFVNRVNKKGGGVAIYVQKNLKFTVMDKMSVAVDGLLECITIEVCNESGKNVIVSCIYRSPGSSLEVFSDWMEKMFHSQNNKILFICGDFNIDLINPGNHKATDDFISRMYSMSLYPTITRPSRITAQSTTLIDNIFTNNIENTYMSGLTICDITDHLPVFTLSDINKFKSKNSADCHDIDMTVVKKVINSISKPLTYICNLSLQTGRFPNQMKMAKVIPIYKSGDKHLFTNYRPISLLPQFSKILEKIFNDKLAKFIDKYNIINENQYGFRENRSTSMAIIDAVEEITNALDKKKYAAGIFIDLKKAFDTLNHDTLLEKLEVYGIRGVALSWVKSYLTERKQFVKINEFTSEAKGISCGVPQGSILGPLLFNIYINDIFNVSKLLKLILFADDTNIFYSTDNQRELINVLNTELIKIKSWMDYNKLSLNLDKSKVMFFGNYKANTELSIKVNNDLIESVTEMKFLGIVIDKKLSWKPHIRHIQTKVSKSISIINKSKYILEYNCRYLLYCSLILPYFTYCIEVWGNNYKSSLHPLFLLQKRAIRIIHKAGYLDHTNNLFYQSRILKLYDLVDFYTAQLLYRASGKTLPYNIQKQFLENEGGYKLRGCRNFKVRLIRTTKKSFCVSVCGTKLWNKLSNELKQCSSIYKFKKMYKETLISQYEDKTKRSTVV
ncbi:uncharacterized protein LOC112138628 [Oryzias melastigma]|uniref:uncharacterized protein LOC112138628 n=1 Tax=Oryzias melastigma TaxID=30732 RepID=UPI000CF82715|nr:uncharacterized protein LOC112138628 [Oryzias melastigma]